MGILVDCRCRARDWRLTWVAAKFLHIRRSRALLLGNCYSLVCIVNVYIRSFGECIAHASIGFGFKFKPSGPYVADLKDLGQVLAELRSAAVDVRILSVHFGSESQLTPSVGAI